MAFVSQLYPGEIITDDSAAAPPSRNDYELRDWTAHPYGSLPYCRSFEIDLTPEDEWKERIEEQERKKQRLSDVLNLFSLPTSNQNGTNYCWMHGTVNALRLVRAKNGQPNLMLSAASAAARVKNFANRGGWSGEAVRHLAKHGVNTHDEWPENAINRRYLTGQNKEAAEKRRVDDWVELNSGSFAQAITCMLKGFPLAAGFNWWRHLVCLMDPVILGSGEIGIRYWNSHGGKGIGILSGRRKYHGDAVALMSASVVDA